MCSPGGKAMPEQREQPKQDFPYDFVSVAERGMRTYTKWHHVLADPLERQYQRVSGQRREILVIFEGEGRVRSADAESVHDDVTPAAADGLMMQGFKAALL